MIIKAPYTQPLPFINRLINGYSLLPDKQWNSLHLNMPKQMGLGGLRIFTRQNLHFYRAKLDFTQPTGFQALDEVGTNDLIDFRINKYRNLQSSYVQGVKKFAWDITHVDGVRMFIPKSLIQTDRKVIDKKIEKFIINEQMNQLLDDLLSIPPDDSNKALLMEARFLEFIHCLTQYLNQVELEQLLDDYFHYDTQQIELAKEILDQHLINPPSIKALSKEVGLNTRKLKSHFRQKFGITIRQYVIQQRMQEARKLILQSDLPISQICQTVGYNNRGHFAATYEKYFGCLPHLERQ